MFLINSRNLSSHKTGVQRYTEEIVKRFPKNSYSLLSPNLWPRGKIGHLWEQLVLPYKANRILLWCPSNTGPVLYRKQIVTIHDVVPFDHPEWLNQSFAKWYRLIQPILVKNARHVITISNFSKERILHHFNIASDKVSVIYNGVDDSFFNSESKILTSIPFQRYILSLGSLEPRKNLGRLLVAWEKISPKYPDVGLVIAGSKGSVRVFKDYNIKSDLKKVFFTGHIQDDHLPGLYRNAEAFFYLSEYEGFGIPPLESMASGTLTVTSNRTAIPEVVDNSAIMVDPFKITEIEDSIELSLVMNEDEKKELVKKGVNRAKRFSWQETADKTYKKIMEFV